MMKRLMAICSTEGLQVSPGTLPPSTPPLARRTPGTTGTRQYHIKEVSVLSHVARRDRAPPGCDTHAAGGRPRPAPCARRRARAAQVNESALQALAEGSNGDIRLILGQLQLIRLRSRTLSYDQAKARAPAPGRRQTVLTPCGPPGGPARLCISTNAPWEGGLRA